MKRYQITVGGQAFDVRVLTDPSEKKVSVEVDGERLEVEVEALPERGGTGDAAADPEAVDSGVVAPASPVGDVSEANVRAPAGNSVRAPLPGVVKSIAVQPGRRVAVGDEMLVIEAMKMDNAIRAIREGVINAVHVSEGHRVAHGQILIDYRD